MSDGLSQTMAQMIAQAKPQFQVPQRNRTITTPGPIKSRDVQAHGYVDPVAGKRMYEELSGMPDPETRRKQAAFMHEFFNLKKSEADTPEKQEELNIMLSNPGLQKNMQSWAEAGYGGIIPSGRKDPQGKDVYDWMYGPPSIESLKSAAFAAMPPEAKQREVTRAPTETEVKAGGYEAARPGARQQYIGAEQAVRERTPTEMGQAKELITHEAEAKPTEAGVLSRGGVPAATYTSWQRRIQAPDDTLVKLRDAQIAEHTVTRQLKEEELKNKPEEFQLYKRSQIAQETQFNAYANRANAEADAIRGGEKYRLKSQKADETIKAVEKLDKNFDDLYKALTQKTAQLPDIETSRYKSINDLGAAVAAHVTGMKNYTGSGAMGVRSYMTWLQMVDREFERPALKTGWLGGNKEMIDQQNRRKWYVRNAAQFVNMMGGVPKGYEGMVTNYILRWAKAAGISDNELDQMFGLEQETK